jgi:hypothetical protein
MSKRPPAQRSVLALLAGLASGIAAPRTVSLSVSIAALP